MPDVLVHLAAGLGNIVLASPLLLALEEMGFTVDLRLSADYDETAELFRGWSTVRSVWSRSDQVPERDYRHVIPAIPPFYWPHFQRYYDGCRNCVTRPRDELFYHNEQEYYLAFARTLGFSGRAPDCRLPIAPTAESGIGAETVVLVPGCKTGEMAMKRWPHFPVLAQRFEDAAVVGVPDDLRGPDGAVLAFPPHVRNLVGQLSLRQTAELLAGAGVVVANDCGLGHLAAAVGTPTIMIFGPTPHLTLGPMPSHVRIVRRGLDCEPCWFGARFEACARARDCLCGLNVDLVEKAVRALRKEH